MNTRYLIRATKYLLWLLILFILIFGLMLLTGATQHDPTQTLRELFGTQRGAMMICAVVVLALFYPLFGFVRRVVPFLFAENRDAIVAAFTRSGYRLVEENERGMMFRSDSALKKIMLLGEDLILVVPTPEGFILEGIRREVVSVEFRLKSLLK